MFPQGGARRPQDFLGSCGLVISLVCMSEARLVCASLSLSFSCLGGEASSHFELVLGSASVLLPNIRVIVGVWDLRFRLRVGIPARPRE